MPFDKEIATGESLLATKKRGIARVRGRHRDSRRGGPTRCSAAYESTTE